LPLLAASVPPLSLSFLVSPFLGRLPPWPDAARELPRVVNPPTKLLAAVEKLMDVSLKALRLLE